MRIHMNSVKALIITQYLKYKSVLDLGVGKGQDL